MAEEEKKSKKKRSPSRRLTPTEWAEAAALWESGEYTLDLLSKRYGITREALSRKFKDMGAVKGASADLNHDEVRKAINEGVTIGRDEIAKKLVDTRNKHYQYAEAIAKMIMGELASAAKTKQPFGSKKDNIKALNEAVTGLNKAFEQRLIALGVKVGEFDLGEELPDLKISKMTEDDIEAVIAAGNGEEYDEIDMENDT